MKKLCALLLGSTGLSCAWGGSVLNEQTTGIRFHRPPLASRGEHGTVYTKDVELAEETKRVLRDIGPRIRALFPWKADTPQIWLMERELGTGSRASYVEGDRQNFILVGPVEVRELEHILAHELVHWFSQASAPDLPVVVEEGLADLLTAELVPAWAESIYFLRAARFEPATWTTEQALRITYEEWAQTPGWQELEPRAIGFGIARSVGTGGLEALRRRARSLGLDQVPPEWFLDG